MKWWEYRKWFARVPWKTITSRFSGLLWTNWKEMIQIYDKRFQSKLMQKTFVYNTLNKIGCLNLIQQFRIKTNMYNVYY